MICFCTGTVWDLQKGIYPTDAYGATYIPTVQKPSGMDRFLSPTETNTPTNARNFTTTASHDN